jgi:intracellular sulfur oxidation DsrE/DsrF family protein
VNVQNTVILLTNNGMGRADQELQQKLFVKYLEVLLLHQDLPAALCFYTDGVKLVCEGSPALEALQALESRGVHLIICSTCLAYLDLTEKVQVGIVGGMGDIVEAQNKAEKVITI